MFSRNILRMTLSVALVLGVATVVIAFPADRAQRASTDRTLLARFSDRAIVTSRHFTSQIHTTLASSFGSNSYIRPGAPFEYTEFGGSQEEVVPWVGTNVALLVPESESSSLKPKVMSEVVNALDSAWAEYELVTGQSPTPYFTHDGRDSVAVVRKDSACAGDAACSYLGETGTEIFKPYFETLYDGVQQNNQYDQALFYEFGRNFWFYGNSLAGTESPGTTYGSTVTTGFAVFMRFRSMDATGTPGGPFNGTPFPTFEAQDWSLVYDYDSDLSDTFANTLAVGQSPGPNGGTDFLASILNLLTRYGGDCFLQHFLSDAASESAATSDDEAVTNFVNAATEAAGVNLGPFFYDYWGFPQSDGQTNPRAANGIANLPRFPTSSGC
jgi:hypothetical protein